MEAREVKSQITLEELRDWMESEAAYHRDMRTDILNQTDNKGLANWHRGKASAYQDIIHIIDRKELPDGQ